jgi:hypothetical protein
MLLLTARVALSAAHIPHLLSAMQSLSARRCAFAAPAPAAPAAGARRLRLPAAAAMKLYTHPASRGRIVEWCVDVARSSVFHLQ